MCYHANIETVLSQAKGRCAMVKQTLSQQVADFGTKLKFEDLPEHVVANSKKFILDLLGNILASKHVESSQSICHTVMELGGNPASSVMGWRYKTSPQLAALANATMGHGFDMDDDHREGTQHPSVVVFPAVFALAEAHRKSGQDLITAYVYGTEITIRLGEALLGQSYYQGFHATGTCGVFGAAGGCAKLMGLDADGITRALGIAGSQAAGLLEWKAQGTWTKRFQAGHPAMCGVLSQAMSAHGYTSPTTVWEGEDGFVRAYAYQDHYDLSRITDGLGNKWEMGDTSIKVHACCRFAAAVADCAMDLYQRGINAHDVESIAAKICNVSIKLLCMPPALKYNPKTVVDAQFSVPYVVACGMVKGKESIAEYTDEAVHDANVLEFAKKVTWELDPYAESVYPKFYACTLVCKMKDGSEVVAKVDYPKGDPENPVSWAETVDKFRFMASHHIGRMEMDKIIAMVADLENMDDVSELATVLS